MQRKKDEMEKSLLTAAHDEFLEQGFERASIRSIVKSANTTIGNFYNYYKNKEAIFCALVDEVYNGFIYVVRHHNDIGEAEINLNDLDMHTLRQIIKMQLNNVLPKLDSSFFLLIEKSAGTKYSHAKQELIDMLSEHFTYHIDETNPKYRYPEMGKFLSLQLVEGALAILQDSIDYEQKLIYLTELMIYIITGMLGMLKGEQNA